MSGALQPVELVPLILGLGAATGFLGLAIGFWILYIGLGLTAIGLIGWVYEYSGNHAH